jgi:hypothetical protein
MQSMLPLKYKMWGIPNVLHVYYNHNCTAPKQFFSCTHDFSVPAKQNYVLTYLSQVEEVKHTCEQQN